jgi:hypothetical protein
MAKQEAAPRRLSSKSTTPAPQRGTRRASTLRLRRRQAPFPRNTPTPSRRTTPARSRRTCWASPSYLRQRCSPPLARLRHHPSTKRLTAVSTYGPSGSEEDDEPDFFWDFSGLGNPSAMQDFMTACDYCLSDCSDGSRSFGDEDRGPSRECFHIDLGGPGEGNHLGVLENGDPPRPVPRVDILRELAVVPVPAGVRTHSSSKSARCRPGSTREQEHLSSSGGTSGRNGQTKLRPEKRVIYPRASSTALPTTSGQVCHRFPVGSART